MASNKTLNTLLAGAVALTIAGAATPADAAKGKEKCYGVAKAGMNDCANAAKTHSCAGYSTVDGNGGEWVALPKGTCDKIVGGSTEPFEGTHGTSHEGNDGHDDHAGHTGHEGNDYHEGHAH